MLSARLSVSRFSQRTIAGRDCACTLDSTVNSGELRILYPVPVCVTGKYMVCFGHKLQYKTIELYQP